MIQKGYTKEMNDIIFDLSGSVNKGHMIERNPRGERCKGERWLDGVGITLGVSNRKYSERKEVGNGFM